MSNLAFPLGASVSRLRVHGKDVAEARNEIVASALGMGATYILFIGDDNLPPPNLFNLLHRHREHLVTGVYWSKQYPSLPYLWHGLLKGHYTAWKYGEYFPIDFAGVDALLAHTDVFRAIEPPWFTRDWTFEPGQAVGPHYTEDFPLYAKAKAAGFTLWVDTAAQLGHQDRTTGHVFGLTTDMPQMKKDAPHPSADPQILVADIGCGIDSPWFGSNAKVIRYDIDATVRPDVRCDIRAIPEPDETFDIVHCYPAGELILTPDGFRTVEQMQAGGEVISHAGERRTVLHTFERDYVGAARRIMPSGYPVGVRVTPGHPFYGYRAKALGSYTRTGWDQRLGKMRRLGDPEWIPSHEIERGDVLVCPIPDRVMIPEPFDFAKYLRSDDMEAYEAVRALPVPVGRGAGGSAALKERAADLGVPFTQARGWRYHGKRPFGFYSDDETVTWHGASKESSVKRFVAISPDLMRLLGYWLADGWTHAGQMGFIFGEHEGEYVDDVTCLMRDLFGADPIRDQPDGTKTIRVRYTNRALVAAWSILTESYKGAHGKQIPSWAYWLPSTWQRELLIGFLRGDGCLSMEGRREVLTTVSRLLAEGLRFLYLRCGMAASLSVGPPSSGVINGRSVSGVACYRVSTMNDERTKNKGTYIDGGVLYSTVRAIEDVWLSESVYNCQVDVDESYLTPYAASHNSRHVLEHFMWEEAPALVREWTRILKTGGELRVNVPNLAYAAREIIKADADAAYSPGLYPLWQVYGKQSGSFGEVHRHGFTRHSLRSLLEHCGLTDVSVDVAGDVGENLEARATKTVHPTPLAIGPLLRGDENVATEVRVTSMPANGHDAEAMAVAGKGGG